MDTKTIVEQVYERHNELLIIGLTGVTGAACTAARKSLESGHLGCVNDYKDTNLHRDQAIIGQFLKVNWGKGFKVIRGRHVLTLFVLQDHKNFREVILKSLATGNIDILAEWNEILNDISQSFLGEQLTQKIEDATGPFGVVDESLSEFMTVTVPQISDKLNDMLKKLQRVANHFVYQNVSILLRTFGRIPASIGEEQPSDSIFTIARGYDLFIKAYKRQFSKEGSLRIVIERIENPFEVNYLRNKYPRFYLIATSAKESDRINRLTYKGYSPDEMFMLQVSERPRSTRKEYVLWKKRCETDNTRDTYKQYDAYFTNLGLGGAKGLKTLWLNAYEDNTFIFQLPDIEACVQAADIFIDSKLLREDQVSPVLARYVSLMLHPGLVQPTDDERCMQIAQTVKVNSGCISRQVGAVVCDTQSEILAVGWNDPSVLSGNECITCARRNLMDWCKGYDVNAYSEFEQSDQRYKEYVFGYAKTNQASVSPEVFQRYLESQKRNLQGLPLAFCFKQLYCNFTGNADGTYTRAQHGEERAMEKCSRRLTEGGTLYCTTSSCELCSKKILHYGIRRVVFIEPYAGIAENHVLGQFGAGGLVRMELFTGACNRAYIQLFNPIFPLKDELAWRGLDLSVQLMPEYAAVIEEEVSVTPEEKKDKGKPFGGGGDPEIEGRYPINEAK